MEISQSELEAILGRKEHHHLASIEDSLLGLGDAKVLITGALGSIGTRLRQRLRQKNINFLATDRDGGECEKMDIRDAEEVKRVVSGYDPTHIIHLAAQKDAPTGELEIDATVDLNIQGTRHVMTACQGRAIKLIAASTCKASNPETVYGSTKLLVERMVMAMGGVIAKKFNVVQTSENVFQIWGRIPSNESIPVAETCSRYFITLDESVGLLLYCMSQREGKYMVHPGNIRNMRDVAKGLYPNRNLEIIAPRRGDRLLELLHAKNEDIEFTSTSGIFQVIAK